MKYWLLSILLLAMTGCCRITELSHWPAKDALDPASSLYQFRLERSNETNFSGLLATQPREDGMRSILLDATGIPLVKMLIFTDGTTQIEYCATALRDSRLPELLGKLIVYIYFTPANADCPWYVFSCICREEKISERSMVKWKRFGPLNLWEIEKEMFQAMNERITVHMHLYSISVYLQRIDNKSGR